MTQVYNITPVVKRLLIAVPVWLLSVSILTFLIRVFYQGGPMVGSTALFVISFPYGFGVLLNAILAWAWPLYVAVLFQVLIWFLHNWFETTLYQMLDPRAWSFHVLMTLIMAITAWSRRRIPWRLQMLWHRRK